MRSGGGGVAACLPRYSRPDGVKSRHGKVREAGAVGDCGSCKTQRGAATKLQHGVQVEQRSKDECWRKVVEDALAAKEKRRLYGAARFHLRTQ